MHGAPPELKREQPRATTWWAPGREGSAADVSSPLKKHKFHAKKPTRYTPGAGLVPGLVPAEASLPPPLPPPALAAAPPPPAHPSLPRASSSAARHRSQSQAGPEHPFSDLRAP